MRPHVTESDVAALLCDHQSGHSDLQIDHFIVEKGNWTPYGRYKQALREIAGRHSNLQSMREDAELAELDLQSAWSWLRQWTRRGRIAIHRRRRQIEQFHRTIAEQERELERFVSLASGLKKQVGELTPARRVELDQELWSVRARAMVAMDMFTNGSLSPATAELLIALPVAIRKPILAAAMTPEAPGGLFDWLTEGPKALPE